MKTNQRPTPKTNILHTDGIVYRILFQRRRKAINQFVELSGRFAEKGKEDYEFFPKLDAPSYRNSFELLLEIGADKLSARAFRDVCRRIIDKTKCEVKRQDGDQMVASFYIPSWRDPNPLFPALPDGLVRDFLRHSRKSKLEISPLYNAAFEASRFEASRFVSNLLPKQKPSAQKTCEHPNHSD
jgi:hypothetical protein